MKRILSLLLLSISCLVIVAQGPTKKCPTCGLSIAKCEYRGKHPKPTKPARPANGSENGHEWVDLGLPSGTKWATMNVGANSPEEPGDYFAWGETSPKSSYDWINLRYRLSGDYYANLKFSKYVTDSKYGDVDGKEELDVSDDAAYANWGGGWRMPSVSQIDELSSNCTFSWTSMNGTYGYKVTSKRNGNSIFLPNTGHWIEGESNPIHDTSGYYWSRSLETDRPLSAYCLEPYHDNLCTKTQYRYQGQSVRAVFQ